MCVYFSSEHLFVTFMSLKLSSVYNDVFYISNHRNRYSSVQSRSLSDFSVFKCAGISAGESTGATMSDDDADDYDSDYGAYDSNLDPQDSGGFGPLVPTESERTLMERVRQELKYELKQVCPGCYLQF